MMSDTSLQSYTDFTCVIYITYGYFLFPAPLFAELSTERAKYAYYILKRSNAYRPMRQ